MLFHFMSVTSTVEEKRDNSVLPWFGTTTVFRFHFLIKLLTLPIKFFNFELLEFGVI